MTATKDNLFKPTKLSTEVKAQNTNAAVQDILAAETAAREKKTEKLRALRLAQPQAESPKKKPRS